MEPPETRYAKSGDINIAYQVFGEGSGLRLEDRGLHALKGLPEEVRLYTVLGAA